MSKQTSPDELADRALQRLRALPSTGGPASPFTCELSVDELLLVDGAGIEPVQLVMGSCVHHVTPRLDLVSTGELTYVTRAMYQARRLAMTRMNQEAARLRADGVIGVRVELDFERWGEDLIEFTAVGTAVRGHSAGLKVGGRPFTCHLSGQEVAALVLAGYRPVALVLGAAVWRVAPDALAGWLDRWRSGELTGLTAALAVARELAAGRMGLEARRGRAAGVVGVTMEERSHAWGGRTIEVLALGTAVRPLDRPAAKVSPSLVVPLDAPTERAAGVAVSVRPQPRGR